MNGAFEGILYVTIDTEIDADIHWKKGNPASFTSVLQGIPQLLRPIWDEYKINPVYFVSPEVLENEDCCQVLKNEISKGALIGAHLHGDFIEPNKKDFSEVQKEVFPCFGFSTELEKEKILNLKNKIKEKLGVETKWYRAARFGADNDTIKILSDLGFENDSSFTPCIDWSKIGGPNHSAVPLAPYDIKLDNGKTVREFPVTIMGKRLGILGRLLSNNWLFYNWLRPTHMTYFEERALLRKLKKRGLQTLVMMFHSMEVMICKTPYVRAKWMQKYYLWRLKKTLAYAQKLGYRGGV